MAKGIMESHDFDRYTTLSEKAAHENAVAANAAFVLAMAKAVRKGREKAAPGTFVDLTPAINARRIYADIAISACGSPAAMCMESGALAGGAVTLK